MVELKGKQLLVKAILALLVLGVLSYGYLPQAKCDLEKDEHGNPKIVRYIYLSDSRKTATIVLPNIDEGGFNILDDRCQKGAEIGQWQPLKEIPKQECPVCTHSPWVLMYVNNCETGETEKLLCDHFGMDATCNKANDISMPFG